MFVRASGSLFPLALPRNRGPHASLSPLSKCVAQATSIFGYHAPAQGTPYHRRVIPHRSKMESALTIGICSLIPCAIRRRSNGSLFCDGVPGLPPLWHGRV